MTSALDSAAAWSLACLVIAHGLAVAGAFVVVLLRLRDLAARVEALREDVDDLEVDNRRTSRLDA